MNTYFWKRWADLDQLVRALTVAYPPLLRRLADAPDQVVHVYALFLRSSFATATFPVVEAYHGLNGDRPLAMALVRDPARSENILRLAQFLHGYSLEDLLSLDQCFEPMLDTIDIQMQLKF